MRHAKHLVGCVLFFLLGAALGVARPSPARRQKPKTPAAQSAIHRQVNEITTPVTVTDKKGNFLLGIPEKDFHVYDNGVEQHINRWGLVNQRLAIALVIESSAHIAVMARMIRSSGIVFTQMLMGLSGEATVIGYGEKVDVLQPFTANQNAVQRAIEHISFNSDGMRLYDGMWEGELLLRNQPPDSHRVLVVIGEAQDSHSKHTLGDVLELAQQANISIYAIGLSSTMGDLRADSASQAPAGPSSPFPAGVQPMPGPPGMPAGVDEGGVGGGGDFLGAAIWLVQRITNRKKNHAMEVAVAETGGDYFHPKKDRAIEEALNHIGNELHSQYVLSYQLRGPATAGIHEIRVTVSRPHVIVRARLGYYLVPPGS